MKVDPATKAMQGSVKGAPQDWRKATFMKALSPVETLLFGVGGGTEWKFERRRRCAVRRNFYGQRDRATSVPD